MGLLVHIEPGEDSRDGDGIDLLAVVLRVDGSLCRVSMSLELMKVPEIFIDADGCPVKQEVFRVAQRYGLRVTLVANTRIQVPKGDWVKLVVVEGQFDAADDWIVGHASADDIVVSGDILLAARCLEIGAQVLGYRGDTFTPDTIGEALAMRASLAHLRELGTITGGPAPFGKRDRSRFLQRLDEIVQGIRMKS